METEKILIDEIEMNDDRTDGGKGDIESLARNMAKYGQINAVTVVEDISNSYRYRIVAGRRRITAAQSLGWTEIRADVYKADEIGKESEEMIALSENAAREEMNAIDEGVLYANELKRGTPVEELAALFCRNKSTVYQRAKLASLIPEMREFYKNDKMSLHVAAMAAVLPEEAQKGISEKVGSGWVSEWDIKRAVSNASNDTLSQLEGCADCVNCAKRTHYSDKTLFPELADESDKCLDHDCYCKKLCAKIEAAFSAWESENKGSPEFDAWDARRIVSTVGIPDGLHIMGISVSEFDDDAETDIRAHASEYSFSEEAIESLQAEGKTEIVPCWDGTAFTFMELVKNEDIEALFDNNEKDGEKGEDEWTQKRREKMADIFQSLGDEWCKENLSKTDDFYRLERNVSEIFEDKLRSAVSAENDEKILVTEQIALITLLYCSVNELREILPDAGITEDDKAYSLSVYEKLLSVKRGAILRALLKSHLSGYKTKPPVAGLDGSDWQKIFAYLDIDLTALRDEAAKEAAGVKSEECAVSASETAVETDGTESLSQTTNETPPETTEPEASEPPAEEIGSDAEDDDGLDEQPFDYGDDGDDYDETAEDEYEHDRMFYEED